MASSCQHLHICIFCNQWELSTKIVLLVSIHLCGWGQGQHWVPLSPLGKAELGGSFPEISVDGLLLLERSQWDPKCHDARAQRWAAVPCWPQQQKASPVSSGAAPGSVVLLTSDLLQMHGRTVGWAHFPGLRWPSCMGEGL